MTEEKTRYFSAPWGTLVRAVTGVALLLSAAIPALVLATVNLTFAAITAGSTWFVVLLTLVYAVRGYVITESELVILRLGWERRYRLADLRSVKADPQAMNGSIRLFGNGGLFAFTGVFRNSRLGTYRAYVTDPEKSVVLVFKGRTIVVTPQSPALFVDLITAEMDAVQKSNP